MTKEEMKDLWKQYMETDFLKFDRVEDPLCLRPDLCGFLLLDTLVPAKSKEDLIVASEHDEYYLSIDPEEAAKVIQPAQIQYLVRCGVRYNYDDDCFELFA